MRHQPIDLLAANVSRLRESFSVSPRSIGFGDDFIDFIVPGGGRGSVLPGDPGGLCDLIPNEALRRACQAVSGIVPGGGTDSPPCGFQSVRDPITGQCVSVAPTGQGGVDLTPGITSPAELGPSMHANGHRDHIPVLEARPTRRCARGAVLGKDGWCHPKGTIRNSDRMYPKGPRPIGTPGDIKAVRKASSFGRRLKTQEKRLRKLGKDLGTCPPKRGR